MPQTRDVPRLANDIVTAVGLVAAILAMLLLSLIFVWTGFGLAHPDGSATWLATFLNQVRDAPPHSPLAHGLVIVGWFALGAIGLLFAAVLRRLRRS